MQNCNYLRCRSVIKCSLIRGNGERFNGDDQQQDLLEAIDSIVLRKYNFKYVIDVKTRQYFNTQQTQKTYGKMNRAQK